MDTPNDEPRILAIDPGTCRHWRSAGVSLLIAIGTFLVFARVAGNSFVNYDDPDYVNANAVVLRGWTAEGMAWAFTTVKASNWHPVTWLSHMTDVELFGQGPAAHHLVNALIHALNAGTLFWLLVRMTGAAWRSALAAALFAVHPLRVESVAWISERKDVVSLFFGLLSLHAYVTWSQRNRWRNYVFSLFWLAVGLMAKPMLVTLPCVMLLLDFWPLRRFETRSARALVLEKIPMLIMVAASAAVTVAVQSRAGAVKPLDAFDLGHRVANACVSYAMYIWQTVWPVNMAVIYPQSKNIPWTHWVPALLLLLLITSVAFALVRKRPNILVGWLWFLGTLVPVIGVVQVGEQSRADRYTYLPSIGLSLMIAWTIPPAVAAGKPAMARLVGAAAAIILGVLSLRTIAQINVWRDSGSLFAHAIRVTSDNAVANSNFGLHLMDQGRYEAAEPYFHEVLRIQPRFPAALTNIGLILAERGEFEKAAEYHRRALDIQPKYSEAHHNLATALARLNRLPEAEAEYREALRVSPDAHESAYNLAVVLLLQNRLDEAAQILQGVVAERPDLQQANAQLGLVLLRLGDYSGAVDPLQKAVRSQPDSAELHNALGVALFRVSRQRDALAHFEAALRIQPDYAEARINLQRLKDSLGSRP